MRMGIQNHEAAQQFAMLVPTPLGNCRPNCHWGKPRTTGLGTVGKPGELRTRSAGEMADAETAGYQIFFRPASESSVQSIGDFPSG